MVSSLVSLLLLLTLIISGMQNLGVEKLIRRSSPDHSVGSRSEAVIPPGLSKEAAVYHNIRHNALHLDAKYFNRFGAQKFWTILTEMRRGEDSITLLTGVDGTVSLYTSSGQRSLGHGTYQAVREAAQSLFQRAQQSVTQLVRAEGFPLPQDGELVFYLYGPEGIFTASIPEYDFDPDHPLYPMMVSANNVLASMGTEKKGSLPDEPFTKKILDNNRATGVE